jgi:hypothetical protein
MLPHAAPYEELLKVVQSHPCTKRVYSVYHCTVGVPGRPENHTQTVRLWDNMRPPKYDVTWKVDDVEHRDGDEPSFLKFDAHGKCVMQEWRRNGVLHREGDKPASINGSTLQWYKDGILHREGDKPANIHCLPVLFCPGPVSCVVCLEWWVEGRKHRQTPNAPARTMAKALKDLPEELHELSDNHSFDTEWWDQGRFVKCSSWRDAPPTDPSLWEADIAAYRT